MAISVGTLPGSTARPPLGEAGSTTQPSSSFGARPGIRLAKMLCFLPLGLPRGDLAATGAFPASSGSRKSRQRDWFASEDERRSFRMELSFLMRPLITSGFMCEKV
jgi:hypothetical protein